MIHLGLGSEVIPMIDSTWPDTRLEVVIVGLLDLRNKIGDGELLLDPPTVKKGTGNFGGNIFGPTLHRRK